MSTLDYPNFKFTVTHRDPSGSRVGLLETPHGAIETPNFIFCATKAALKGVTTAQAKEAGAEIILSNTYHLLLQPGGKIVQAHGGLHRFLGWNGPMLTDSGGFQIFSLGHGSVADEIKGRRSLPWGKSTLKISEEGALFRSYINGEKIFLTPEKSIQTQVELGADLIVVLDECTPYHCDKKYTERSMHLSHRWEQRSLAEFTRLHEGRQALYGIVQGGIYPDLRKESASFVASQPFFGQAVGGSLGGDKSQMHDVVGMAAAYLHPQRPTHLLGIGGLSDILNGVTLGMDTFDCTHPTRLARHGGALVTPALSEGKSHLNLKNSRFKEDLNPIDDDCSCYTCQNFSRSYIHHLIKADELLSGQLLTIHNIAFMMKVARDIRAAIKAGTFTKLRKFLLGE